MEIINRRQRIFSISRKFRRDDKKVGFVPTMGALHAGHLKLVEECRQRTDITIVSIFVNPTQFNDKADLEKYPRDLTQDAAMLAELGVDYIYAPDADEIYPEGFSTYVDVEGLTSRMEGAFRPGHFRGVATVVTILFNTIRPDIAFFGQKDAQQVAVIERLTRDLGFEMEIAVLPTVREPSGLAMSSRNERLSDADRKKAVVLFDALCAAERAFKGGEPNAASLAEIVKDTIKKEPAATLDYVSIVDRKTLQPIEKIGDSEVLIAAAIEIGGVRLIDNLILDNRQ
ncbi:MAG: pantoate--beta-alanine ligase [Acidobacteria bacterium OLB17]|nr:MAG: pantoate--beta-alanine ligase [Acidobacteria bacterium OLB17]MCZ2391356.1 pantoate--beta-alanine ligase [Acidobacteriota bacterium]